MRLIDADSINFESNEFDTYNDYLTAFDAVDKAETIDPWHYPSRGEYPTEGETVLVAFQEGGLWYFANAEYHEGGWASVVDLGNIVAWQYIIPPKEETDART